MAIASYIVSRITSQLNDELSVSLLCPILLLCLGESQPIRIFNSSLICRRGAPVFSSPRYSKLSLFFFFCCQTMVCTCRIQLYEGVKGHIIPHSPVFTFQILSKNSELIWSLIGYHASPTLPDGVANGFLSLPSERHQNCHLKTEAFRYLENWNRLLLELQRSAGVTLLGETSCVLRLSRAISRATASSMYFLNSVVLPSFTRHKLRVE